MITTFQKYVLYFYFHIVCIYSNTFLILTYIVSFFFLDNMMDTIDRDSMINYKPMSQITNALKSNRTRGVGQAQILSSVASLFQVPGILDDRRKRELFDLAAIVARQAMSNVSNDENGE